MMATDAWKPTENEASVRLVGLTTATPQEGPAQAFKVVFHVKWHYTEFDVPIFISEQAFDEADVIQVARDALHRVISELREKTESWVLDEEELRSLRRASPIDQ